MCTINEIEYSDHLPPDHYNYCSVGVEERPGTLYNYKYLLDEQDELKEQFGDQVGYPDPDVDTPWIEKGDIVNGEEYTQVREAPVSMLLAMGFTSLVCIILFFYPACQRQSMGIPGF